MIKEDDYIGLYTETLKPRNPLDLYKTSSLQLLKHKAVNHLKIRTAQICFGEQAVLLRTLERLSLLLNSRPLERVSSGLY